MSDAIKKMVFNGIEYNILNKIVFNNIYYFLIFNGEKYKIVYKMGDEYFQLIKNSKYKEIIKKLYSNIKE